MKKLALFLLLLLASVHVQKAYTPRTWYVSTAASTPAGSDGNDGTSGSPFLTPLHAVTMAQCGDTVHINSGAYNGFSVTADVQQFCASWSLPITVEGSSTAAVTLTEPGSTGIIGFNPGSHYTNVKANAYPVYWIISDLTLDGTGGQSGVASNIQSLAVSHVQFVRVHSTNSQRPPFADGAFWWFFDCEFDHTVVSHGLYVPATDSIISGGSYHDNAGLGAQFTDSGHNDINNSLVRKAKFYNNGSLGLAMSNGSGGIVENVQAWNNVSAGIAIGASGVCSSCSVLNSTAYQNNGYGIFFGNIPTAGGAVTGTTNIKNNISYGNNNTDILDGNSANGGSGGTINVSYNLTGGAITNPGSWTTATNNTTGDPLFTNGATHDFSLTVSSPAIDAGTDLSAYFTVDYLGNTRPYGSAFDKGAFEYNGATCTADHLTFTAQPSDAVLGATLGTVTVAVKNAAGTTCGGATNAITLSRNGSATWNGLASTSNLMQSASGGFYSWTDLSVNSTAGSGSITASASGLTAANSSSITITSGCTPHHLTVTSQPASALLGISLGTITVAVKDSGGATCVSATNTITLTKSTCTGMTLNGTVSGAAQTGVFSTTDVNMTARTGSCALTAAATGLTSATTSSVSISEVETLIGGFTVNASASSSGVGAGALGRLRLRTR